MARIVEKLTTGSTNDDAKQLAEAGAPHFTVVWAHRQESGRGRHGRAWLSQEGNVAWSVILRPQDSWPDVGQLVFVNALAVYDAVREITRETGDLRIKWPNDLLLNGRKLSGSLLEAKMSSGGRREWIVIGTGLNVVGHPEPSGTLFPPTSLHAEGFEKATRDQLLVALARHLARSIDEWCTEGFEKVRTRYLEHCYGLGEVLRISGGGTHGTSVVGKFQTITEDGALMLIAEDGTPLTFHAGEILAEIP